VNFRNKLGEHTVERNKSVFGIYGSRDGVKSGMAALQAAGFPSAELSLLLPESCAATEVEAGRVNEGAAAGTAGAMIGGALVWLVGIGGLAIPGLGPFIMAGQIMAALAGTGAYGAGGGFAGALVSLGIPECKARRYETRLRHGEILVAVSGETIEDVDRAKMVLSEMGAEDILATNESASDGPMEEHNPAVSGARGQLACAAQPRV
jgi:hypothetical protein